MSTTVTIQNRDYSMRRPSLLESLRFRALRDVLRGDDQIRLWFWAFGTLADDLEMQEQGTMTLTGGWLMEHLREVHPDCTPAELWEAALEARDAFFAAFEAPVGDDTGLLVSVEQEVDEARSLGNSSGALPKVGPSFAGAKPLDSGSETQAAPLGA